MTLKISPFAESDLQESINFYNEQQENLGQSFLGVINETFTSIKNNPLQFPKAYKEFRRVITPRFPFIIFFVMKEDVCYVLAIFHTSRNPNIIKDRFTSDG
jgi:toxin ParE1/3/4